MWPLMVTHTNRIVFLAINMCNNHSSKLENLPRQHVEVFDHELHSEININNHMTTTGSLDITRVKVPCLKGVNAHNTF